MNRDELQALMDMPGYGAAAKVPKVRRKRGATATPAGYAAVPGTGPEGEKCQTCAHLNRSDGFTKTYLKCVLMRAFWTGGRKTDILAGSPACSKWEKADG